jgi:hypothetical protein
MENYIFSQDIDKPETNEEYYTLIGMQVRKSYLLMKI